MRQLRAATSALGSLVDFILMLERLANRPAASTGKTACVHESRINSAHW
ncbi:hypothetical protein [Streptodolium elevatio]